LKQSRYICQQKLVSEIAFEKKNYFIHKIHHDGGVLVVGKSIFSRMRTIPRKSIGFGALD
jgi:hypothetical protein